MLFLIIGVFYSFPWEEKVYGIYLIYCLEKGKGIMFDFIVFSELLANYYNLVIG